MKMDINNIIYITDDGVIITQDTLRHINKKEIRFNNLEEIIQILSKSSNEYIEYIEVDTRGELIRGFSGGNRVTKISLIDNELYTLAFDEKGDTRKLITLYSNNGKFSRIHKVKDCFDRIIETRSEIYGWSDEYDNLLSKLDGGSLEEKREYFIERAYDEI